MELQTVTIRKENGCYECKHYKKVVNHWARSGICKKYEKQFDQWDEAIEQCKKDRLVPKKIDTEEE
jgi:hypothetical protein